MALTKRTSLNHAKELAVKFFKRNPNAAAAHIVLNSVTDNLQKATKYMKAVSAKKVSSFLRSECAAELNAVPSSSPSGEVSNEQFDESKIIPSSPIDINETN